MDGALLTRLFALVLPALLGAVAGRARLFDAPRDALGVLNQYALYIGFPALITLGLTRATLELPASPWFWLIWPLALLVTLTTLRLAPVPRARAGTLALVLCFGNVAYLGLPYVEAVFGAQMKGVAALAVSIHVTGAVTLGPALLERWAGAGEVRAREVFARVARLPLFWAPLVGLLTRELPTGAHALWVALLSPLAASAAPVALFMLGLYLYLERARLFNVNASAFAHLAIRLLVAPALVFGMSWIAVRFGGLPASLGQLHVVLASMPVAITTFSMAYRTGVGEEQVGAAIVWSSLLAIALVPAWTWLAMRAM